MPDISNIPKLWKDKDMTDLEALPVAIVGAGPIGLAAAARLLERGIEPILFEKGAHAGAAMAEWGHVRLFSPWRYNIDDAAGAMLAAAGWTSPDPDTLPTGAEIVRDYLQPLAALPAIAGALHTKARVEAITRLDRSKPGSDGRDQAPFVVLWRDSTGRRVRTLARAVIDASGTWGNPNPIGLDGRPVDGEAENADRISYGIPDVRGAARELFAGRHTLVIGAGHSATNVALDLLALQRDAPATRITWATRAGGIARLLGGGLNDELPERGQLGLAATQAIASGKLMLLSPFALRQITRTETGLTIAAELDRRACAFEVDHIVVATGFRPDLEPLREVRLALDPVVEAPVALAPLIDPNLHSCGTVPAHGVVELAHPEKDFFLVGMKSYGRAPTFLMATGHEQVRSIAAELAGDTKAAREVHLVLPETGVCSAQSAFDQSASCCGGPAPQGTNACCVQDAEAKASGSAGCGCNDARPKASACCAVPA
jgi:NADPH-dependent 2,4-dienoyl-CoA reductase/sulfur reductase-like enzyme